MPTIHYLQWHRSEPTADSQASDLFHAFHVDPPTEFTATEFDDLYADVAEPETTDLEQLFAEGNRGSGRESEQFYNVRYCERCHSYIEGSSEAVTHAAQNHSYEALNDPSEPAYIHGVRSLSVGDIVEQADQYYACAPIGWKEMQIVEGDAGST